MKREMLILAKRAPTIVRELTCPNTLSLSPQIKRTFPKTNEYSPKQIAKDSVVIMAAVVTSCVCNHVVTVQLPLFVAVLP
jgi:hypothetical protein